MSVGQHPPPPPPIDQLGQGELVLVWHSVAQTSVMSPSSVGLSLWSLIVCGQQTMWESQFLHTRASEYSRKYRGKMKSSGLICRILVLLGKVPRAENKGHLNLFCSRSGFHQTKKPPTTTLHTPQLLRWSPRPPKLAAQRGVCFVLFRLVLASIIH